MQDSLSGYGRLRGAERNSERLLLPGDVCLRGQQANARQQVLLCGDRAAAPTLATRTAAVDTAVASVGWYCCGLTIEECKDACLEMGGCVELLVVAANGCCFPARSVCDGNRLPNEDKYVLDTCVL